MLGGKSYHGGQLLDSFRGSHFARLSRIFQQRAITFRTDLFASSSCPSLRRTATRCSWREEV